MPSKSKSQQRLMGQAYAWATGKTKDVPKKIKDVAKSFMRGGKKDGKKALRDFAKTKHDKLPEKIKESEMIYLQKFESFGDKFTIKSEEMISDIKELGEYPENKIIELEKLMLSNNHDDRKEFVKSIMNILKLSKWDLPDDFYRYL